MKSAKLIVTIQATFLVGLLIFSGAIANMSPQGVISAVSQPDTMLKAELNLEVDENPAAQQRMVGKLTTLATMLSAAEQGEVPEALLPALKDLGSDVAIVTDVIASLEANNVNPALITPLKDAISRTLVPVDGKTSSSGIMAVLSIEELLATQPGAQREIDAIISRLSQGDTTLAVNRAIIFNELSSDIGPAQFILPSILAKDTVDGRVFIALATNSSTEQLLAIAFAAEPNSVPVQTVAIEDIEALAAVRNTADTIVTTNWVRMLAQHELSSLKTMSSSLPFTGTAKASSAGVKAVVVGSVTLNIAGQQITFNQNALDEIIETSDSNRGLLTEIEQLRFALDLDMDMKDIQDVFIGQAEFFEAGEAIGDTAFLLVPTGVTGLKSQILVAVVNDNTPQEAVVAGIVESITAAKATPSLAKTSSSGLAELAGIKLTNIEFVNNYVQSVLNVVEKLQALVVKQFQTKEELRSEVEALKADADKLTSQDLATLEKASAESTIALSTEHEESLEKAKRAAADLSKVIYTTPDMVSQIDQSIITTAATTEKAAPSVIKRVTDILVEAEGGMETQFAAAARAKVLSEVHGKEVSELDVINGKVVCDMRSINIKAIGTVDVGNTIAVAVTEAGAEAFKAKGIENVIMLKDLVADGKYDLLSLAALSKGRFLKANGIEDNALDLLMHSAYRNLTGREMPADYLAKAAMVIDVILLPVDVAYDPGELEAYHLMRLLAMIAA